MNRMRRYLPVLLLCLCMLVAVLFCLDRQISDNLLSYVRFRDMVTGNELKPFYDEDESKYYLFLPAYASPENVKVTFTLGGGEHRIYL